MDDNRVDENWGLDGKDDTPDLWIEWGTGDDESIPMEIFEEWDPENGGKVKVVEKNPAAVLAGPGVKEVIKSSC